jgi:hypothetical protein
MGVLTLSVGPGFTKINIVGRLHDSNSPEKYTIKDALSFLHNQQNV